MKKRKRKPAHEPVTEHRTRFTPEGCPFDFADAVWHDDRGRYWPAMTHCLRDSGEEGDCAIKSEPYEEAIDAARTAQFDLEKLIDEPELPQTSSEVKSLMLKFGYSMRPKVEPEDCLPVEAVFYAFERKHVKTLSPADMNPADARLYGLLKRKGCVEPFDDPHMLCAQVINILFDLIPAANRIALLLRWEDEPENPEDFQTSLYGKRKAEGRRFRVSEKAFKFVYTYRTPYTSEGEKPPCICAPLSRGGWPMIGMVYLDTREPGGFQIEDVKVLEKISRSAASLIARSLRRHLDREEMDDYQALLRLDEFSEPDL